MFNTIAPFVMLCLWSRYLVQQNLDNAFSEDELISNLKSNAMIGLSLYKKIYSKKVKKSQKKS